MHFPVFVFLDMMLLQLLEFWLIQVTIDLQSRSSFGFAYMVLAIFRLARFSICLPYCCPRVFCLQQYSTFLVWLSVMCPVGGGRLYRSSGEVVDAAKVFSVRADQKRFSWGGRSENILFNRTHRVKLKWVFSQRPEERKTRVEHRVVVVAL